MKPLHRAVQRLASCHGRGLDFIEKHMIGQRRELVEHVPGRELGEVAGGGEKGPLAGGMHDADRELGRSRRARPARGTLRKRIAQPCAKWVTAHVGDDAVACAERGERQAGIACLPADAQFRVRQDGLGADSRPLRERPQDQIDIDVAGDVKGTGLRTCVHAGRIVTSSLQRTGAILPA
jgi:hypothetical protein